MSILPVLNLTNSCVEDNLEPHDASPDSNKNWKVIVIDDEKTEHLITTVFLEGIVVDGRGVDIIDGYSAKEASTLLQKHPDVAVVIVDVVMETKFSGFEVIRYLREILHNRNVRIIIRSGSTCNPVNMNSIQDYDISEQAEKADITADKLKTMVTTAIEEYTELQAQHGIKKIKLPLKKRVALGQLIKLRESDVSLEQENDTVTLGSWEWNAITNILKFYSKSACFSNVFPPNATFCLQDLFTTFSGLNQQIAVTIIETAIVSSHSFDFEHFIADNDGAALLIHHQGRALIDPESGDPCAAADHGIFHEAISHTPFKGSKTST